MAVWMMVGIVVKMGLRMTVRIRVMCNDRFHNFDFRQKDRRTFVIVETLSRQKTVILTKMLMRAHLSPAFPPAGSVKALGWISSLCPGLRCQLVPPSARDLGYVPRAQ